MMSPGSKKFICLLLSTSFLFHCSRSIEIENNSTKNSIDHNKKEELYYFKSINNEISENFSELRNLIIHSDKFLPSHLIKLKAVNQYGNNDELYISLVLDALEDINGNVIIWGADHSYTQSLYIFNQDGSFFKKLGANGRGPGEYLHINQIYSVKDKIYVSDGTNKRLNEYSAIDYSFIKSTLFETWKGDHVLDLASIEPRADENFLAAFTDFGPTFGRTKIELNIMNDSGTTLNSEPIVIPDVFRIDLETTYQPKMPLGFMGYSIIATTKDDAIYYMNTDKFLIQKFDHTGEYQYSIYYPLAKLPFDLNDYTNNQLFSHNTRDIINAFKTMNIELPKEVSSLKQMLVDDQNRIWIALLNGPESEYYQWWILSDTGNLIAKLLLPQDERLLDLKKDYVYTRKKNQDNESEYVIKYRIELAEIAY